MIETALLICGLVIGPLYVLLYILGGAMRSGYSHVTHSVSELLTAGAPNKPILAIVQIIYALLHVAFGVGVWLTAKELSGSVLGSIGVWTIVAIGIATIGTVIFPQDAEGAPSTAAGSIHKSLVFGVLVPSSILSTLLIGLWSRRVDALTGFALYSYISVGAIVAMGALGGVSVKTRFAGLSERVAALVTHQWLFALALWLLMKWPNPA